MSDQIETRPGMGTGSMILIAALSLAIGVVAVYFLGVKPAIKQAKAIQLEKFKADSATAAQSARAFKAESDLASCDTDKTSLQTTVDLLKPAVDTLKPMVAVLDSTLKARDAQLAQALAGKGGKVKKTKTTTPGATVDSTQLVAKIPGKATGKSKPR